MKNTMTCLSLALAFCAASSMAAAEGLSEDDQKLERTSAELDKDAALPGGQKSVETRLKSEYKVDDARVQGLRDQKLGYGEISIALALAQKMPGGITDENVKAVMALRQGPPVMGWGQIAKKQGVKLGKLMGSAKGADAKARKEEKAEGRAEKAARPEKAERPAGNARPEKAGNHGRSKR